MKIAKLALGLVAALGIAGSASAAGTGIYAGISAAEDSTFGHLGAVHALNGDLSREGVLLRGMLSYGTYDYVRVGLPGSHVDGDATGFELGVGYQWVNPGMRVSLYGGLDYQDHDLSPNDPTNSVRGSEAGAAIQGEVETTGPGWYGGLIAKYSSAYDTYWARGRLGYPIGGMHVGPEVILGGNEEYDEARYGLFLRVPMSASTALAVSAGHRRAQGDGLHVDQSGGYLGLTVSTQF